MLKSDMSGSFRRRLVGLTLAESTTPARDLSPNR
jgi:hypothetical protein